MTVSSPAPPISPENLIGTEEALRRLGLAVATDPQIQRRLATTGLVDCLPLASLDEARVVVLRGSSDLEQPAPGVAVASILDGESMLVAEHAGAFVPIWIITSLVNGTAEQWDAWRQLGEAGWGPVIELHRRLGGSDGLPGVHAVLEDGGMRAALCRDLEGGSWPAALPHAFATAAPQDRRGQFQHLIDRVADSGWVPELDPQHAPSLGAWRAPLDTVLGIRGHPPDPRLRTHLLRKALRRPSGHDASWVSLGGVGDFSGKAGRERGAPILTARAFVERTGLDPADPWTVAARALATAGPSYDGRAHLSLVGPLREQEDHAGAWQSALTAAFWMFRRYRTVHEEVQLVFADLARRLGLGQTEAIVVSNLRIMGARL